MTVGPVPAGTPGRQPTGRALTPQAGYSPAGATRRARPVIQTRPCLAPPSYRGPNRAAPFWRRAKPAKGPQARRPRKGARSSGGPPDAAGTDKMQGRPRPKRIKAGPCILPLHFGRSCGMALPPPGQPTGQAGGHRGKPQKEKRAWACVHLRSPRRFSAGGEATWSGWGRGPDPERRGPIKGRGLGGGYISSRQLTQGAARRRPDGSRQGALSE